MKKVAGRLRLDLAQYRELEAFAQFGSELDPQTQRTLARGERMVATLNQPQYKPWPMEEQVAAIWVAVNGYLDEVPADQVPRFQEELREHLRTEGEIYKTIRESGDLGGDLEEKLKAAGREVPGQLRRAGDVSRLAMAEVQDIKRRIRSVRNTRKITKAMELVAGARLRRAQARIEAMRPYADRMLELMVGTARASTSVRGLPLLQRREIRTAAILALTGDRGPGRRVQRAGPAARVRGRATAARRRRRRALARLRPQGRLDAALPPLRASSRRGSASATGPRTRIARRSRTTSPSSTPRKRSTR